MSSDTPLTDAEYVTTYDGGDHPHWATAVRHGPYAGYCYTQEAADHLTKMLNERITLERRVSQLEAQLAEARKDSERLAKADRLALYDGKDGHREWWSGGTWLYPGDEIIQLDAKP